MSDDDLKSENEFVEPVIEEHGWNIQNSLVPGWDGGIDLDGCQILQLANLSPML
jgi:hypothetical protein